jgi:exopolysaccharide production protein ExoQ
MAMVMAAGGIDRPHRQASAASFWPAERVDTAFTFVLFAATLFTLQFGGLVLVYTASVLLFVAVRSRVAGPALLRCAPILVLPLYAIASTFWSAAPATTLYYGTEYLITVIAAIFIGAAASGGSALKGMFAAFFLWASANLLFGLASGAFARGTPFVGLAGGKNAAGDAATLGLIIGVAMLVESIRSRWPGLIAASIMLVLIEVAIIVAAQSTGAIIAGGIGVLAILGWTVSRILPVPARTLILIATIIVALAAAATEHLWAGQIFGDMLSLSGKDTTLTGRTYIWGRAQVLIAQRPWLGLGYSAFWRVGALEPEAIWRKLLITGRAGFHFHNSAYDILVPLGYVGLGLFALIFVVYGGRLMLRTMRHADGEGIAFAALLVSFLSRAPFESFGTAIFHQTTLLLFAALAWATRPPERNTSGVAIDRSLRRPSPQQWQPPGARVWR